MANNDKPPSSNTLKKYWQKSIIRLFTKIPQNREMITEILRTAESNNLIDPDALIMIEGALAVSEIQVRDIMVARVQMVLVHHDDKPKKILNTVVESGHSRFPVVGEDNDEIIGILLAKDLLAFFAASDNKNFNIKDAMRPAVFVPESKRLNVLLREFRLNRNHMAIVIDEYSGVAGLVTIEDIIEEIVGEIEDEHDYEEEENIRPHSRNRFTVNAFTPIDDFNEYFNVRFCDDEYDTIGGLVLHAFGHLPKRGETTGYGGFQFTVLRAGKRKINLLRIVKHDPSGQDNT